MAKTPGLAIGFIVSVGCLAQNQPLIQVTPYLAELRLQAAVGGDLSTTQALTVTSLNGVPINFFVQTDGGADGVPAAGWIRVSRSSGTTPARINVSADPVSLASANYQARILIIPAQSTANRITIPVSFFVLDLPAAIEIAPSTVRFGPGQGGYRNPLFIRNSGGGRPFPFTIENVDRTSWLSFTPSQGGTAPNTATRISVIATIAGLRPGAYRSRLRVRSDFGVRDIPVALFIPPDAPVLGVSPNGFQFEMNQGNGTSTTRSLRIVNLGSGTLNWNAQIVQGGQWLNPLNPASGTVTPGSAGNLTLSVSTTTISTGVYYALLRINAPQALNSPQFVPLVLSVRQGDRPANPAPSPSGLVFVGRSGSQAGPPQVLRVFASSLSGANFYASGSSDDGLGWLSLSNTIGATSTTAPGEIRVTADASRLQPNIYTGEINIILSNSELRTANVTYVVQPRQTVAPSAKPGENALAGCTPARLSVTHTGLVSSFSAPAAWPTPLAVRLLDDCGEPVTNGEVVATFSNGDPPLPMRLTNANDGVYTGTWVPRGAATPVNVTARASAGGFNTVSAQLVGAVQPNQAPVLSENGIVNNLSREDFDNQTRVCCLPLAPGTIVEVFGASMAAATVLPVLPPWPLATNGTSVIVGGVEAPLHLVSAGQINAQIPMELPPDREYQVLVSANGQFTVPETIALTAVQPGLAESGDGKVLAQHGADFRNISSSSPAAPGEHIILYLVGMGLVNVTVKSGEASPLPPSSNVVVQPVVTIGGKQAQILFAGLTPGFVGLYQINLLVPSDAGTGDLTLVVSQDGVAANMSVLPVR